MENQTQHTQGEWMAYGTTVALPYKDVILGIEGAEICNMHDSRLPDVECQANARLVAAAPALLAALECIVASAMYCNSDDVCIDVHKDKIDQARAAIAKVKGK